MPEFGAGVAFEDLGGTTVVSKGGPALGTPDNKSSAKAEMISYSASVRSKDWSRRVLFVAALVMLICVFFHAIGHVKTPIHVPDCETRLTLTPGISVEPISYTCPNEKKVEAVMHAELIFFGLKTSALLIMFTALLVTLNKLVSASKEDDDMQLEHPVTALIQKAMSLFEKK